MTVCVIPSSFSRDRKAERPVVRVIILVHSALACRSASLSLQKVDERQAKEEPRLLQDGAQVWEARYLPSQTFGAISATRAARDSTSAWVMLLTGWSMTTGIKPSMPIAVRVSTVSFSNSVVMIAAEGMPSFSSATESRMQQEQQDPQSPIAVRTRSLLAAISAISSGSASFEKQPFT